MQPSSTLESFLQRLRLLDDDGSLSITSIVQTIIIVKVALSQDLGWASFFFLALVLLQVNFVRLLRRKELWLEEAEAKAAEREVDAKRIEQIETDLQVLKQVAQFSKLKG